ncbi:MAG: hypothetical protein KAG61_04010 [Bacteriovoracaceae bacterium]|nr:hypothetical protein [Bacteriovoracaceae bacterium]
MNKKLGTFILFLLLSSTAVAEYRVYQYYVRAKDPMPQDKDAYLVTSSLNPTSYIRYHGGDQSIEIELLRSWMCKGHTGEFKKYCSAPYDSISAPNIAN